MIIHTNYQEIKIQENAKSLAVGTVPRSICVLLQDDLADMCQTGGMYLAYITLLCHWLLVDHPVILLYIGFLLSQRQQ